MCVGRVASSPCKRLVVVCVYYSVVRRRRSPNNTGISRRFVVVTLWVKFFLGKRRRCTFRSQLKIKLALSLPPFLDTVPLGLAEREREREIEARVCCSIDPAINQCAFSASASQTYTFPQVSP